jgi:hypothetical protein
MPFSKYHLTGKSQQVNKNTVQAGYCATKWELYTFVSFFDCMLAVFTVHALIRWRQREQTYEVIQNWLTVQEKQQE